MREIKFRGLSTTSGQWIYGDLVQRVADFIFPEGVYTTKIYEYLIEIRPETKGQYTGLKDSGGEGIYEGDIIWDSHDGEYGEVTYEDGAFYAEWETHVELLSEINDVIDITGNIYDHQDILEDK